MIGSPIRGGFDTELIVPDARVPRAEINESCCSEGIRPRVRPESTRSGVIHSDHEVITSVTALAAGLRQLGSRERRNYQGQDQEV